MLVMPHGTLPKHVARMLVRYEQRPGIPPIAPKWLSVDADSMARHLRFAAPADAVHAARMLAARDHHARLVIRKPDGSFDVYTARVAAESGWFLLGPNWMRSVGVRSLTFADFDPDLVAIVDADHVVANPLSQIG